MVDFGRYGIPYFSQATHTTISAMPHLPTAAPNQGAPVNDLALPEMTVPEQMTPETLKSCFDFDQIRADLDARISYSKGHVYVIERPDGLVKIGRTTSPDKRLRAITLQGGFKPKQTWLSDPLKHANFVEKACHSSLKAWRTIGEWFEYPFDSAVITARLASLYEGRVHRVIRCLAKEPSLSLQMAMEETDRLCQMVHEEISFIGDEDFAEVARATLAPELNRIAGELSVCASRIRNAAEQIGTRINQEHATCATQ